MPLERFIPKSPDPFIRNSQDFEVAKFGHLNTIIEYVNTYVVTDSLQLDGTGPLTSTARYITDSLGNASSLAISTGNIGIGTTNATARLRVISADTNGIAEFFQNGFASSPLHLTRYTGLVGINLNTAAGGSVSPVPVGDNIQMSRITTNTYNGTAFANSARIEVLTKGIQSATNYGSVMRFLTTPENATSMNEVMSLTSDGNVQIGIGYLVAGGAKLAIKGSGSTSATSSLLVQNSGGLVALEVLDDSRVKLGNSSDFTVYSGAGVVSRFAMNVGSTSLPTAQLQVKGSGSTSATTSLLVQNSGGTTALTVKDDLSSTFGSTIFQSMGTSSLNFLVSGTTSQTSDRGIFIGSGTFSNASVVGVGLGNGINLGTGTGNVAIGFAANSSGGSVVIGAGGTAASASGGVAIKGTATTGIAISGTAITGVAIGGNSTGSSVAIGGSSAATGALATALGDRASAGFRSSIAIGALTSATADNQLVIGGNDGGSNIYFVNDVYIGGGVQDKNNGNGTSITINPSGGGNATDKNGGNLTLAGGKPTGAGTAGDVIISTSTTGASGTTLRTLTNRWWIKGTTGTLANVSSPDASAALQADSTTQGFLPPRMTTAQRTAIVSPAAGLIVYDTTTNKSYTYDGTAWQAHY